MNTLSSKSPEYHTKDIFVATILRQSGIPIVRVENNGRQGIFVFQASEKINDLITQYFNGQLRTDPKSLFETWRSLKSMAFSAIGDVR